MLAIGDFTLVYGNYTDTIGMVKSISIYVFLIFALLESSCTDNDTINGHLDLPEDESTAPIGLTLKLSDCYQTPPEALPYVCDTGAELVYENSVASLTDKKLSPKQIDRFARVRKNRRLAVDEIQYELVNNLCPGLIISSTGQLDGVIQKSNLESCSYTVRASSSGYTVEDTVVLNISSSLTVSLDQSTIVLQDDGIEKIITLQLSQPAPYATYFEFEVFGGTVDTVTGLFSSTRRVPIPAGATSVDLRLSIPGDTSLTQPEYKQIQFITGSSFALPSFSLYSYSAQTSIPQFSEISNGSYHSCGIKIGVATAKELYCWGSDSDGQIGNGAASSIEVTSPEKVGNLSDWQHVSAGNKHTCGIEGGDLYCWGKDISGEVGNGAGSTDVLAPERVGVVGGWTHVEAGYEHSCGINAGNLYCWGRDNLEQLGNGPGTADVLSPLQYLAITGWTMIDVGYDHSCGLAANKLYCWGNDNDGQVGNGASAAPDEPELIMGATDWTLISAGGFNSCGITTAKELYCWGYDSLSQIGNGPASSADVESPEQIGALTTWDRVSVGDRHSCGVIAGELYCWGHDNLGQIGNGPEATLDVAAPLRIGADSDWGAISMGSRSSCGLKNGEIHCWGDDGNSQLGKGSGSSGLVLTPQVVGNNIGWDQVSSGTNFSCAIKNGELFCWGSDNHGQVANGSASSSNSNAPQRIGFSNTWSSISAGEEHACAINNKTLYCWGRDDFGQVGNGIDTSTDIYSPQVIGALTEWQSVSAGENHTCGINNKELYCWGSDSDGQVGNGFVSVVNILEPEKIAGSATWEKLSLGFDHSCGIDNGELFCWGSDINGQTGVGVGSATNIEAPQKIGSATAWQEISSGEKFSCGIEAGQLFCWGLDSNGQIGNGIGSPDIIAPEKIELSSTWKHISVGYRHACAIDGSELFCWGYAYYGQLGTGSTATATINEAPQKIGTLNSWEKITSGDKHSCGVTAGSLRCWGLNKYGQVAQSPTLSDSPFLIIDW